MTTTTLPTNRDNAEINRFDRLDVEGFTLHDDKGASRHFERDHDLDHKTRKALGSGSQRAVLLITLGIDEYDCHRVQLDYRPGHYDETCYVVDEAIAALEVIRQQLSVMTSTPDARFSEHNAFTLGVEAERAGLPVKVREEA